MMMMHLNRISSGYQKLRYEQFCVQFTKEIIQKRQIWMSYLLSNYLCTFILYTFDIIRKIHT